MWFVKSLCRDGILSQVTLFCDLKMNDFYWLMDTQVRARRRLRKTLKSRALNLALSPYTSRLDSSGCAHLLSNVMKKQLEATLIIGGWSKLCWYLGEEPLLNDQMQLGYFWVELQTMGSSWYTLQLLRVTFLSLATSVPALTHSIPSSPILFTDG